MNGVIASPIAAATVALVGLLAGVNVGLPQILLVIVPATLVGTLLGTLSVAWRGKELADDPEYKRRVKEGTITAPPRSRRSRAWRVGGRSGLAWCSWRRSSWWSVSACSPGRGRSTRGWSRA